MIFVDTNYFLRFLLNDIKKQHLTAKKLFLSAAEGKKELTTSLIVFFEVYWVLKSYYEKNKEELVKTMKKLLELNFIKLNERVILEQSINLYTDYNLSLEDCYNLSYIKQHQLKDLASFDEKLNKVFKKLK